MSDQIDIVAARPEGGAQPRVLSGIMPTGSLHLGNYLGAMVHWVKIQHQYPSFFCVVDLHAITTPQDPAELRAKIREVAGLFLAAGIDPKISTIFVQSDVPAHAELAWPLECLTPMGRLQRMTQFKEKSAAQREQASAGLFTYPVLQAADILLYGGEPPRPVLVPVGADQKQHLELARDLAVRFNRRYGVVFAEPEPLIPSAGAMSKSEKNPLDTLYLLDPPEAIRHKIARAVTGSGREVRFDETQPGLYNLLTIYQVLTGETRAQIEAHFQGRGYAELKQELAELIIQTLQPLQQRYAELQADPRLLEDVLISGTARARAESRRVLQAARSAMGLGGIADEQVLPDP